MSPALPLQRLGDLLVAEKPAGLLCQPGLGPLQADSLLTRLQLHWPGVQLVHRLDRDTSGLLLLALEPGLHRALSRMFAERTIHKRYRALVEGIPPGDSGEIDAPLARCSRQPPRYGITAGGKPSRTRWRLLGVEAGCSHLALEPVTGRSHQLRVHLASMGCPIVGDPLYGPLPRSPGRLHLHASQLRFDHPLTGESLEFHSPCPF